MTEYPSNPKGFYLIEKLHLPLVKTTTSSFNLCNADKCCPQSTHTSNIVEYMALGRLFQAATDKKVPGNVIQKL